MTAPTLPSVREHLAAAGLARQKWPETLHQVEEFPAHPVGQGAEVPPQAAAERPDGRG